MYSIYIGFLQDACIVGIVKESHVRCWCILAELLFTNNAKSYCLNKALSLV